VSIRNEAQNRVPEPAVQANFPDSQRLKKAPDGSNHRDQIRVLFNKAFNEPETMSAETLRRMVHR
jgi:hypothetical protein